MGYNVIVLLLLAALAHSSSLYGSEYGQNDDDDDDAPKAAAPAAAAPAANNQSDQNNSGGGETASNSGEEGGGGTGRAASGGNNSGRRSVASGGGGGGGGGGGSCGVTMKEQAECARDKTVGKWDAADQRDVTNLVSGETGFNSFGAEDTAGTAKGAGAQLASNDTTTTAAQAQVVDGPASDFSFFTASSQSVPSTSAAVSAQSQVMASTSERASASSTSAFNEIAKGREASPNTTSERGSGTEGGTALITVASRGPASVGAPGSANGVVAGITGGGTVSSLGGGSQTTVGISGVSIPVASVTSSHASQESKAVLLASNLIVPFAEGENGAGKNSVGGGGNTGSLPEGNAQTLVRERGSKFTAQPQGLREKVYRFFGWSAPAATTEETEANFDRQPTSFGTAILAATAMVTLEGGHSAWPILLAIPFFVWLGWRVVRLRRKKGSAK